MKKDESLLGLSVPGASAEQTVCVPGGAGQHGQLLLVLDCQKGFLEGFSMIDPWSKMFLLAFKIQNTD